MVLIKNTGDKPASMSWENIRYVLQPGETKKVGSVVARAYQRRYPAVIPVEPELHQGGEEIVNQEPASEATAHSDGADPTEPKGNENGDSIPPDGELSNPSDQGVVDSNSEEDAGQEVSPPPAKAPANKPSPAQIRNEARKNRKR